MESKQGSKPETLPTVPSIHPDIPPSPLALSQPPSSDVPRAVTALLPQQSCDRPLGLAPLAGSDPDRERGPGGGVVTPAHWLCSQVTGGALLPSDQPRGEENWQVC